MYTLRLSTLSTLTIERLQVTNTACIINWEINTLCQGRVSFVGFILSLAVRYQKVIHWILSTSFYTVALNLLLHLFLPLSRCDINLKDKGGCTPLHIAATRNFPQVLKILIANGANTSFKDNTGKTALQHCVQKVCLFVF